MVLICEMRLLLVLCLLDRCLCFSLFCEVIDIFLMKRCWCLKLVILCEIKVSEFIIYYDYVLIFVGNFLNVFFKIILVFYNKLVLWLFNSYYYYILK